MGKPGRLLMGTGLLLLAAALILTGYNLWDDSRADRAAAAVAEVLPQPGEDAREGEPWGRPGLEMPTVEIGGRRYIGRLTIPSVGVDLPVLSQWTETDGRVAPCRYQGTVWDRDLVIAGHNYRSHFAPLSRVEVGDPVVFTDVTGTSYYYAAAALEILDGTAVEEMTSGDWPLSLFTCTYGGQARLTLRCVGA